MSICMFSGKFLTRNLSIQFLKTNFPNRYLYEFLFGWILSALNRADAFLQEFISEQFKNLSKGQKTKMKKKKMKPYEREFMFTQALQNLCGGYYKALAGFHKSERIPQPLPEFDLEQVRYEHRFAPFADLVTPPPIGYNEFCAHKMVLMRLSQEDLFLSAAKHFHQARTILEHIPNIDPEVNLVNCLINLFDDINFFSGLVTDDGNP